MPIQGAEVSKKAVVLLWRGHDQARTSAKAAHGHIRSQRKAYEPESSLIEGDKAKILTL